MPATTAPTLAPQKPAEAVIHRRFAPAMLDELRDELEHFWDRPWSPFFQPFGKPLRRFGKALAEWAPKMDVFEQNGNLVVKADLPGMTRQDIEVKLEDGDLVLCGERKEEKEVKEDDFYRCERSFGSFYRRFPLSFEVEPEQITAKFNDGVLEVKLPIPKEPPPESHRISVS